ncbi:MAG: cobyric acid synthase [Pseudomonadota bacterium]
MNQTVPTARAVAVMGCTSGAGKSWLATALCRWYARRGLVVKPFKAQNMSNHARVVADAHGRMGEIGSAQYFQALAAGAVPEPRLNPVLLKPEADTRSQVVLMGQVRRDLASMPWRERSALLWPTAQQALRSLRQDCEVLVIEGAGSPAEINLAANDYVNTFTTLEAEAAAILVADIDRGGAFAHLFGTHALMDDRVRARLRGFVLNRFRGDAALLAPGPQMLAQRTGVPLLGVLPMLRGHGLPEEDAVPMGQGGQGGAAGGVVVLATPHASNLDEFEPLARAGVPVHYSRSAAELAQAAWLVLPGSKHTRADADWVRAQGLAPVIAAHIAAGRPLLAVCGALQWLGAVIDDPLGLEGAAPGQSAGLGLLPLHTRFAPAKQLAQAAHRLGALQGPWAPLAGLAVQGYEIHLGQTTPLPGAALPPAFADSPGLGWQQGPVLALYLHGLFENPAVVQALFGRALPPLQQVFDRLADAVDEHIGQAHLLALLQPR